jgi:hypothetical protein
MKLCGNIYFYNVYKTFSFFLNNQQKTLNIGQYQKTDLLNYFLSLGCFDYTNNKLKVNKITTIRFYNLADKNLFFCLGGFFNLLNDNDSIFNLENEAATFDIFVENNILVNLKIFQGTNIILNDTIEVGPFKESLIIDYPQIVYNKNMVVKFFNIFTNEEIKSLNPFFIS